MLGLAGSHSKSMHLVLVPPVAALELFERVFDAFLVLHPTACPRLEGQVRVNGHDEHFRVFGPCHSRPVTAQCGVQPEGAGVLGQLPHALIFPGVDPKLGLVAHQQLLVVELLVGIHVEAAHTTPQRFQG